MSACTFRIPGARLHVEVPTETATQKISLQGSNLRSQGYRAFELIKGFRALFGMNTVLNKSLRYDRYFWDPYRESPSQSLT